MSGATYEDAYDYDQGYVTFDGTVVLNAYTDPNSGYASTTSSYQGASTVTETGTGSGVGSSSAVSFSTRTETATGSGAGAETSAIGLRITFAAALGSGTGSYLTIDGTTSLRGATAIGVGASVNVTLRTAVTTAVGTATGGHVVVYVSYTSHLRALSNGGVSGADVQSFATLLRFSTAAATSSSSSGWRIRKMARYTIGNVIERVRRQLNSTMRTETNIVAAPVGVADTVVTFQFALSNSLRPGAVISIGTELMRVVSVEPNTQEVTVIRGWQDSEPSVVLAGTEASINPRFTRFDVFDALIDEIASWETEIYRIESYQWDVDSDVEAVELPANLAEAIGVVEVVRERNDDRIGVWPRLKFRLQRGSVGTWDAVSTSGLLIRLVFTPDQSRAGKIHALVAVPFDVGEPLAESSNLVTVLGMTPSQVDLLVQGIKVRLLADDENVRSSRQAADASLALNQYNAASNLEHLQVARAVYLRRYSDELNKLRAKYPYKSW